MQATCPHCDAPFEPETFSIASPGGKVIELKTNLCLSCAQTAAIQQAADIRAWDDRAMKPLASLLPEPGAMVAVVCRTCGEVFQTESTVFRGDKREREKTLFPTVCDGCAAKEPRPVAALPDDPAARLRAAWVRMTGSRYEELRRAELPAAIQPFVDRVLTWQMSERGIGLIGAPRTGKSPLVFALGQRLYTTGVDVFPTSGIEFQRNYHRAFDRDDKGTWTTYLARCEDSAVLLLDDADKLNLTPGVESEYYGMLETRRNWQRPVICTLNLSGVEFAALGRDRSDRAAAIVERLRDLCEFIPVS